MLFDPGDRSIQNLDWRQRQFTLRLLDFARFCNHGSHLGPPSIRLTPLIDAGKLPAIQCRAPVRIKRSDLDRLLEAGYTGVATLSRSVSPSIRDGEIPAPGFHS
jgi:hypothetical protein